MAVNKASLRLMEKAGLRLVRTFHLPWPFPIVGDQFGDVEYALDKADWQLVMTAGCLAQQQHRATFLLRRRMRPARRKLTRPRHTQCADIHGSGWWNVGHASEHHEPVFLQRLTLARLIDLRGGP